MIQRDVSFDIAKLLAIFLVVLGHVVGKAAAEFPIGLSNFIVGINMPLFFVISGYFARSTFDRLDVARILRHFRSYFWPLAFVSLCFAILAWPFGLLASRTTASTCLLVLIPIYAIKRFLFAGWFLWALAIMYGLSFVACYFASKFRLSRCLMLAFAFAVVLLILEGIWYMGNVRSHYLFFLFGAFVLRPCLKAKSKVKVVLAASCVITYVVLALEFPPLQEIGLNFYKSSTSLYAMISRPYELVGLLLRFVFATPAIVGLLVLFRTLSQLRVTRVVSSLGSTTLGVYILHEWILDRIVEMPVNGLSLQASAFLAVLLYLSCHLIVVLTSRTRTLSRIVWGKWQVSDCLS